MGCVFHEPASGFSVGKPLLCLTLSGQRADCLAETPILSWAGPPHPKRALPTLVPPTLDLSTLALPAMALPPLAVLMSCGTPMYRNGSQVIRPLGHLNMAPCNERRQVVNMPLRNKSEGGHTTLCLSSSTRTKLSIRQCQVGVPNTF
jgi:hypothetical protein